MLPSLIGRLSLQSCQKAVHSFAHGRVGAVAALSPIVAFSRNAAERTQPFATSAAQAKNVDWKLDSNIFSKYPNEANEEYFQALMAGLKQGVVPRRSVVFRFLSLMKTEEEIKRGIALLEAYSIWMPKMSPVAGGLIVRACSKANAFDEVFKVLNNSRQLRLVLSKSSMNYLLFGLKKANRTDDMLKAFEYLEKRGVSGYNSQSLSIFVGPLIEKHEYTQAVEMMKRFQSKGANARKSYLALLDAITKLPDGENVAARKVAAVAIRGLMKADGFTDAARIQQIDKVIALPTPPAAAAAAAKPAAAPEAKPAA